MNFKLGDGIRPSGLILNALKSYAAQELTKEREAAKGLEGKLSQAEATLSQANAEIAYLKKLLADRLGEEIEKRAKAEARIKELEQDVYNLTIDPKHLYRPEWIKLQDKVAQLESENKELVKALVKIIDQPNETLSNSKAMRWMVEVAEEALKAHRESIK